MKTQLFIVNLLIFFVILSGRLNAQTNYYLMYDKGLSQKVGAENLLTIHKAFYSFQEEFLPPRIIEDNWLHSPANSLYRLAKSYLIDMTIDDFVRVAQHEVFGHGARYREYKATNNSYQINLPFPYGKGGGWAYAYGGGPPTSIDENVAVDFSGSESNTVMADIRRAKWAMGDSIHYRDFYLYFVSVHDLTNYIFAVRWNLSDDEGFKSSNDIKNYIDSINYKYYDKTGKKYSVNDMAWHTAINYLDPFQFIALFSYLRYIFDGNQKMKMPMFSIWDAKYLPAFKIGRAHV